jgi:hypothetical protein
VDLKKADVAGCTGIGCKLLKAHCENVDLLTSRFSKDKNCLANLNALCNLNSHRYIF